MAGDGAGEAMDTSSPTASSVGDGTLVDDFTDSSFQCCVCLDLLYKPIVLACGHISCFWCVYKAMHRLRASHCAICRQPYNHFPSICQLLHFLLLKLEPAAYKRREKEVLEQEKHLEIYSPQFVDHLFSERVRSEADKNNDSLKARKSTASKGPTFPENGLENGICKRISVNDVLCALCKELLYRPVVLNCGHVFCESCLSGIVGHQVKCQVCQSLHPGEFPNICLDLDHFLEEQFPREYVMRRETIMFRKIQCTLGEPSSSVLQTEKQNTKSSCHVTDDRLWLTEDLSNLHIGVGCDSCGMYPIIGKRYKCKDCTETIGFDLCEACYNTSSKLPGRFNQQHTPDHKFELDDSKLLYKILMLRAMPEVRQQDVAEADFPHDDQQDIENHDSVPEGGRNEDEIL
ncbi:E3 ubiquitin-protein ligase PRT1 isoform X2 [Elaeis guineensis]|uniref:E3 ubiquitin-protein ligase PRT1 isoform X2 n=1 Tax=Elaeis guineensis var. tenera TaxID=51953 RepID=A0A6I9R4J2_ELAGV|nr:E3 ubiquitin-protein ligase PRT1 isoform X2 [Elaeis guineensis]